MRGVPARLCRVTELLVDVLETAREQVLERGEGLTEEQALACLQLPDERLPELLELVHEVRM
ncbi:MAG: hypothetical protein ABR549_09460, partial [Mycobacteriales bacterium]